MKITLDSFSGIAPKVNPPLLTGNMGVIANNLRVDRGSLRPIKALTTVATIASTARSLFRYLSNWYYWATAGVDAVRSPIANDQWNRIYYTGISYPKMSVYPHATPTLGGFDLGIPKPAIAPTLGVTVGSGTPKERYYFFTYVSQNGEEGPPSPVSSVLSCVDGDTVTLTFTSDSYSPNYNLGGSALRRVYRTALGTTGSIFELVGDFAIASLTVTENKLDSALGSVCPSAGWFPPPTNLTGLKSSPNGFLVGFAGNALCASEDYLPHAWNPLNQLSFPGQITGIALTGDSIVVFTDDMPYFVTGSSAASLSAIKIDHAQTCASKASIVNMGGYAIFASPDGLCSVSGNDIQIVTQDYFTREQWQAYSPATLRGFFYEGIYIGISSTAAFMFDVRENPPKLTTLDTSTFNHVSGFNDLSGDLLYLLDASGHIQSWETGTTQALEWKSKPLRLAEPVCPAVLRAYAQGAFTFTLYADGTNVFSQSITDSNPVRLPSGYRAKEFQIDISGTSVIESVEIADSMGSLNNG